MRNSLALLASSIAAAAAADDQSLTVEQVRLSATGDATSMVATWATSNHTVSDYVPTCEFGPAPGAYPHHTEAGSTDGYVAFGIKSPALHMATMTGLKPGRVQYWYRCGDAKLGFSDEFTFHTAPTDGSLSFVFYADMGVSLSKGTATQTALLAQAGKVDIALHGGGE